MNQAKSSLLDIEMDCKYDSSTCAAPANLQVATSDDGVKVSWSSVSSADGYIVYRRTGNYGSWDNIGNTKSLRYTDDSVESGKKYTYRVVPYVEQSEELSYGDFSYKGKTISIK